MEYSFNSSSFDGNYIGFQLGLVRNGASSLLLNNDTALHITPPRKAATADKALIALRNHSEAERRRRERINAHLATLRTLIPGTNKVLHYLLIIYITLSLTFSILIHILY